MSTNLRFMSSYPASQSSSHLASTWYKAGLLDCHPPFTIKFATMRNSISVFATLALFATVVLVQATPWQPTIRGCAAEITADGDTYQLVSTTTFSQFIQCDYLHDNGGGSFSGAYCFYDFHNYTLYHYPNTPLPVDSSPGCPTTCPLAGKYLIKTSQDLPGECVTMTSNADGAPVQIRECDYRHGNPAQEWAFNGSIMFQGDKCIDVTDGVNANGVRLQTWTCVDGAANQQFLHQGRSVVALPVDFISWYAHPGLCMDLTDGRNVSGNPVQMWACDFENPNQIWQLEPVV
ncbi:ricin B lectin domain-containing protein [Mycena pura]|uniref:Ricin B lectin domain-containing protein n=1 Tax=Mycena pura TaxID=153505 RepID=A0AAD6V730_9AGAR|nr:ricin B lectin domain-containing protein [Mycena pura]